MTSRNLRFELVTLGSESDALPTVLWSLALRGNASSKDLDQTTDPHKIIFLNSEKFFSTLSVLMRTVQIRIRLRECAVCSGLHCPHMPQCSIFFICATQLYYLLQLLSIHCPKHNTSRTWSDTSGLSAERPRGSSDIDRCSEEIGNWSSISPSSGLR